MTHTPIQKNNLLIALGVCLVVGVGIFVLLNGKKNNNIIETSLITLSPLSYKEQTVLLPDEKKIVFSLPQEFNIKLASSGMQRIRFMAKSPDSRLFLTDMKNLSDNNEGKVYILDKFNTETGQFESRATYLSGLRNPNSLAFYKDKEGQHWLYIALTDKLVRYKFTLGEISPTSIPQILATFPDYGLSYKYGGWHLTRTVVIHDDMVYVSVGSSCNSCEEKEKIRASIIKMNPDGSNQELVAQGLRNAVGLAFKNNELYATAMGSDHLGDNQPDEMFYKIKSGTHYGWPYCYQYREEIYSDDTKPWDQSYDCSKVPLADAIFQAHAAPLGLAYFNENSSPELQNSFLVALHGSSDVSLSRGYSIVRVDQDGVVNNFITGFLDDGERYGRPVDILQYDTSSFFFTDDFGGNLYYVYK